MFLGQSRCRILPEQLSISSHRFDSSYNIASPSSHGNPEHERHARYLPSHHYGTFTQLTYWNSGGIIHRVQWVTFVAPDMKLGCVRNCRKLTRLKVYVTERHTPLRITVNSNASHGSKEVISLGQSYMETLQHISYS